MKDGIILVVSTIIVVLCMCIGDIQRITRFETSNSIRSNLRYFKSKGKEDNAKSRKGV